MQLPSDDLDFLEATSTKLDHSPVIEEALENLCKLFALRQMCFSLNPKYIDPLLKRGMRAILHTVSYDAFCHGWREREKEPKDDA